MTEKKTLVLVVWADTTDFGEHSSAELYRFEDRAMADRFAEVALTGDRGWVAVDPEISEGADALAALADAEEMEEEMA